MTAAWLRVQTEDGRDLEVLRTGADDGLPLVFHVGTPCAASEFPSLAEAAGARGWQVLTPSRPGYAGSSPDEGRSVAVVARDVAAILHHVGRDRFVTLGWSGGGPHALACAALLGDRCLAAGTLAGVAPYDADGLDWFAGMGPENVEEFGAAAESEEVLTAYLETQRPTLAQVTGAQVADSFGGLVDHVDRAALTGEFAEEMAGTLRRAVSTGIAGWRDDDLAFVRLWGFELSAMTVPVSVWQGAHDHMVPFAHGEWLAAHIPAARAHLYADEGHISLVRQWARIVEDLAERAGL